MPLKTSVIDAFTTLGLEPEAEYSVASKTYKKLALQHHPDKNRADPDATRRFQEISMAWDVCSKHYENPRSSEQSSFGYDSDDDDYDEMEEELMSDFYEFMFRKMFTGGYNRRDRREWHQGHRQHHHHNPNMYFYTPGYGPEMYYDNYQDFQPHYQSRTNGSGSQRSYSTPQSYNQPSQSQKEHEEYLKRVREFEAEVKAEEKENERAAKEEAKAQDRLVQTRVTAFKAARNGDGALLRRTVEEYNLDVTAPEKPRTKSKKTTFESMLHAAARACDEEALSFLISKGASPSALDDSNLSPFHIAILFGNASAIRYFLSIKPTPEGCHPSKAAQDGRKPLQIAMAARTFNAEALSIIVKEATVHDVEKCWSSATSDDVKSILASKRGFLPPDVSPTGTLSKKAKKKLEEERAKEEKAAKIAEERARAEEKRRAREEKAKVKEQQRLKEEEAARNKAEEEEAIRLVEEAIRRESEEKLKVQEEQRKAEEHKKAPELKKLAEQRRTQEQLRLEEEKASKRRAQDEIKRREAELARKEAELARKEEELRRQNEIIMQENRIHLEQEAQDAARLRAEQEHRERQRVAQEEQTRHRANPSRVEPSTQEESLLQQDSLTSGSAPTQKKRLCRNFVKGACRFEDNCRFYHPEQNLPTPAPQKLQIPSPPSTNSISPSPSPAPAERPQFRKKTCSFYTQGKCAWGAKCRNLHINPSAAPAATTVPSEALPLTPASSSATPIVPKAQLSKPRPVLDEAEKKKRAEQSARDRARIKALKEQQLAAASETAAKTDSTSPDTPTNKGKGQHEPTAMPTPSATPSPSRRGTTSAKLACATQPCPAFAERDWHLISPPMTPEDVQTMVIPDDLFARQVPDEVYGVRDLEDWSPHSQSYSPASTGLKPKPRFHRGYRYRNKTEKS